MAIHQKWSTFSKTELQEAVDNTSSFRGACDYLGRSYNQGLKNVLDKNEIDYTHFYIKSVDQMVGKKYGHLTVISVESHGRRAKIKCKCEICGSECVKRYDGVQSERIITCSDKCTRIVNNTLLLGSDNPAYKGIGDLNAIYFGELKRGAKVRNLEFDVTKEFLWNLFLEQNQKCALSGVDLILCKQQGPRTASLDRIDSSKNYTEENVQWIHKEINFMKRDLDQDHFIEICKKISLHSGGSS